MTNSNDLGGGGRLPPPFDLAHAGFAVEITSYLPCLY